MAKPSRSSSSSSNNEEEEEEKEPPPIQKDVEAIVELVDSFGLVGNSKRIQNILKPVKVISSIPWSSVSGLFRKASQSDQANEIPIPSASHLWRRVTVKCYPISAGIKDIHFLKDKATLYLPVLNLKASSEVILRNLVAYEASMSYSTLEFARYINLMNGIIDTKEDVRLLRQTGVVKGALTDEEIADLFNGMKRSYVRSSNEEKSKLEIEIEKLNEYYNENLGVRIMGCIKKQLYTSWKSRAIFSSVLLFIFLCIQSFCGVYECHKF